ncbi:uncharacterized protein TNCV_100571 [Trichonephila clavipes]|nr:uncharacterized protein TNCV_100571 [Trichonephila clavipes]
MPKFEGPYRVLEVKGNNLIIWKSGKRVTVNIDQVRVYRPRQTDTISSDSQVETLYDEQGVSHRLNKSTTGESRTEGSGRDNKTRQTRATTRGRNKQAERPVRSNQATTRRPCPYYLRSRVKENDGIPEEQRNIEINGIPHSRIRRSLSMEALDGDPGNLIPYLFPINSKKRTGIPYYAALGGSLPQINLGVQGVTQGGHHNGAQRVNPKFRVGSNFPIIPEQYFSGVENVVEFLENMDNNLTYYEIPTQLACAYLKGHLTGRALDWFEVLGYRVNEDKATDYAHLKQALSEQFPVVRNRKIRDSSWESQDIQPNENNRFPNRNREENWRETRGNNRYADNSRPRRELNRFESQGVVDNQRFDGQRRFHNQGGRQGGSRNSFFRGQNDRNRYLNF